MATKKMAGSTPAIGKYADKTCSRLGNYGSDNLRFKKKADRRRDKVNLKKDY